MKKTNLVKKETVIIITLVAFISGFLSGVIYSAFKTPATPVQYAGSQSTEQPTQDIQQQADQVLALKQEITANPENIDAMIKLGDIYFEDNLYQDAISTFIQAEKLAPTSTHILNDLGLLYMNTGEYEEALAKFKTVLDIDPTHVHTLYYVGLVHRDKGETDKALQTFEQVLSMNPDSQLAESVRQEISVLKDQEQLK